MPRTQRAQEISRLEGQLKCLERVDFDELVSYLCRLELIESPLPKALSRYTEAIAEEKRLVAAGIGENHPRLKSVRMQKRLEADSISAQVEEARRYTTSRLEELRKQQRIEK